MRSIERFTYTLRPYRPKLDDWLTDISQSESRNLRGGATGYYELFQHISGLYILTNLAGCQHADTRLTRWLSAPDTALFSQPGGEQQTAGNEQLTIDYRLLAPKQPS